MDTAYAITAKALNVRRDNTHILKDVSFTVGRGKITGLVGPSGSGKTTLMRAIIGAQRIAAGELRVLGEPAGAAGLRPKIGYVTQSPAVYNDLTVLENVQYFATILGKGREAVQRILEQVDLARQASQITASLSGGERARVSLAVALVGDAELLILDEPTVGLDPLLRKHLWGLFAELADSGKTLLISTHVMDEAELCPELLLLRDGMVLSHGTRRDLLTSTKRDTVESAFIALVEEQS